MRVSDTSKVHIAMKGKSIHSFVGLWTIAVAFQAPVSRRYCHERRSRHAALCAAPHLHKRELVSRSQSANVDFSSQALSEDDVSDTLPVILEHYPEQNDYSDELSSESRTFTSTVQDLSQAAIVGIMSGFCVALFKLSIEALRKAFYERAFLADLPLLVAFIPAVGGLMVGGLLLFGDFPPGLKGTVKEVDTASQPAVSNFLTQLKLQINFLRKSAAAVCTLGTGCSLGPEGPCVELGMSVARVCMDIHPRKVNRYMTWNRLLLSCGAAAGVAAGFNAPIAGVFFALEIMQNAFSSVYKDNADGRDEEANLGMFSSAATITPVLVASVLSALVARTFLGNHLVLTLTEYELKTPLVELPLYLILGALSGCIAFAFSRMANVSRQFFSGELGNDVVKAAMRAVPKSVKPAIGGLLCGFVGLHFPQILFFGYETLNSLLANSTLPTTLLMSLLIVKIVMTAVSAGSGLVGGTFAPALFLGAMTGASFHNIISDFFQYAMRAGALNFIGGPVLEVAEVPAYAMVGAACVLAALFRAPLTASLLLFELTRDYDVILPLMVAAGVGSVVCDLLDDKLKRAERMTDLMKKRKMRRVRRDDDGVSWGDLADKDGE